MVISYSQDARLREAISKTFDEGILARYVTQFKKVALKNKSARTSSLNPL